MSKFILSTRNINCSSHNLIHTCAKRYYNVYIICQEPALEAMDFHLTNHFLWLANNYRRLSTFTVRRHTPSSTGMFELGLLWSWANWFSFLSFTLFICNQKNQKIYFAWHLWYKVYENLQIFGIHSVLKTLYFLL